MAARFKLDEIDHKILDMLIENTRMPFTDIAKALEVSAGTVHIRVRKMEESGIIKSSTLTVDYDKNRVYLCGICGYFLREKPSNPVCDRATHRDSLYHTSEHHQWKVQYIVQDSRS